MHVETLGALWHAHMCEHMMDDRIKLSNIHMNNIHVENVLISYYFRWNQLHQNKNNLKKVLKN